MHRVLFILSFAEWILFDVRGSQWQWHSCVRLRWRDRIKGSIWPGDLIHADMVPFPGQSWIITQRAVSPELAACLLHCTGWSLQATTAAGFSRWNLPCWNGEPAGWEWRPGLYKFLWSPFQLPQDIPGCSTEAAVTVLCSGLILASSGPVLPDGFLSVLNP